MKETNARGNTVVRTTTSGDRYAFDFRVCRWSDGWRQFGTASDAPYFGIWYHEAKLEVVTFCEGDVTRVVCADIESFRLELKAEHDFHGPAPAAMVTVGPDGSITEYFDAEDRPPWLGEMSQLYGEREEPVEWRRG